MKKFFKIKQSEILMPQELISKDKIPMQLKERIDELTNLINEKKRALKNAPKGRLRISFQGKTKKPHYYHVKDGGNGVYIPMEKMDLIKALAQKRYDQKVLDVAIKLVKQLDDFNLRYQSKAIEGVWNNTYRGDLIIPAIVTDDVFARCWSSVSYEGKDFDADDPVLRISDGRRVRSKSEVIIAEILISYKIPFRYEFPKLVGQVKVYPDFTCLNVRTRKEIIWEHFGMVDKAEYSNNMVVKMNSYQNNGLVAGVDFIYTMETMKMPISPEMVKLYVEHYLL